MESCFNYSPKLYKDLRGSFRESTNIEYLKSIGINFVFKQQNIVESKKNVLRGMHFQLNPKAQSKLVTVVSGKIFDVAVDLRRKSKNFGKAYSYILSASNKESLFIPKGFAHGYLVLEKNTVVIYNVDEYFYPKLQKTIAWNDEFLSIKWPKSKNLIISKKDKDGEKFQVNSPYFK